jgi:hypothetical protein
MKANLNTIDRLIRIFISVILSILFFFGIVKGILGIIVLVFAGIALFTAIFRFCFLYAILGIKTCKDEEDCE